MALISGVFVNNFFYGKEELLVNSIMQFEFTKSKSKLNEQFYDINEH